MTTIFVAFVLYKVSIAQLVMVLRIWCFTQTETFDIEIEISMDSSICGFLVYFLDVLKKKKSWTSLTSSALREGSLFLSGSLNLHPPGLALVGGAVTGEGSRCYGRCLCKTCWFEHALLHQPLAVMEPKAPKLPEEAKVDKLEGHDSLAAFSLLY